MLELIYGRSAVSDFDVVGNSLLNYRVLGWKKECVCHHLNVTNWNRRPYRLSLLPPSPRQELWTFLASLVGLIPPTRNRPFVDEASQPSDVERHAGGIQTDHGGGEVQMSRQASVTTWNLWFLLSLYRLRLLWCQHKGWSRRPSHSRSPHSYGCQASNLKPNMQCKGKLPKFRNKYSQKRNIGVSVPISTFMRLWVIYIFPRSVCLFCWRKYVEWSLDYINRSQTEECGNWGYSQKRNT
jgi:hypothetical protein